MFNAIRHKAECRRDETEEQVEAAIKLCESTRSRHTRPHGRVLDYLLNQIKIYTLGYGLSEFKLPSGTNKEDPEMLKKHLFHILQSIRDRRIRLDSSLGQTGARSDPIFHVAGTPTPQCESLREEKLRRSQEIVEEAEEAAAIALEKAQQGRKKQRTQPEEPRKIMPDDVARDPEALKGREVVYHFQVEDQVQPVEGGSLLGRRVKKKFGYRTYRGVVKSCRSDVYGHLLYKVLYEDNDSEECSMSELEDILLPVTDELVTPSTIEGFRGTVLEIRSKKSHPKKRKANGTAGSWVQAVALVRWDPEVYPEGHEEAEQEVVLVRSNYGKTCHDGWELYEARAQPCTAVHIGSVPASGESSHEVLGDTLDGLEQPDSRPSEAEFGVQEVQASPQDDDGMQGPDLGDDRRVQRPRLY